MFSQTTSKLSRRLNLIPLTGLIAGISSIVLFLLKQGGYAILIGLAAIVIESISLILYKKLDRTGRKYILYGLICGIVGCSVPATALIIYILYD